MKYVITILFTDVKGKEIERFLDPAAAIWGDTSAAGFVQKFKEISKRCNSDSKCVRERKPLKSLNLSNIKAK